MFRFSYIPYLTACFRHPYYFNGITDDFQFLPTAATQDQLDTFGLRYKNMAGTLAIYQQRDELNNPFQDIDTIADLFFIVTPTSDLLNITERFGSGKYFFSNLLNNGIYQTVLTTTPALSIGDQLPQVSGQQLVLEFLPDTVTKVSLSQIVAGTGWKKFQDHTISPTDTTISLSVNRPAFIQIEKTKKAGGSDISTLIMSDELKRAGNVWGIIHLQIKPGDVLTNYTIDLVPATSLWQYFVVEPTERIGGVLTPSKLAVKCMVTGSRYPATLKLLLQDPATYPASVQNRVNAIKSLPRVRDVHLFQSNTAISILDGEQPKLKLFYDTDELAGKMATPTRDRTDTILIYKL